MSIFQAGRAEFPVVTGSTIKGLIERTGTPLNPEGVYTDCFDGFGISSCQTIRTEEQGSGWVQEYTDGYNVSVMTYKNICIHIFF